MILGIRSSIYSVLAPFLKDQVYMQRTGLATGLKRRGGFGFLPIQKPLSREHLFLSRLDFTGKTIYDVGGHIGLISMFFARAVGRSGRVIAFEPNPDNVAAIRDHIALNGFANILVLPIGLGRRRETLKFVVPNSSARGTAHPDLQERYLKQTGVQVFEINVDTLDHQIAVNQLPTPDFVKIDVEGLELDVLHGMAQTLDAHRPTLWIELHDADSPEVARHLLAKNYCLRQIEDEYELAADNVATAHGHLYAIPLSNDK